MLGRAQETSMRIFCQIKKIICLKGVNLHNSDFQNTCQLSAIELSFLPSPPPPLLSSPPPFSPGPTSPPLLVLLLVFVRFVLNNNLTICSKSSAHVLDQPMVYHVAKVK